MSLKKLVATAAVLVGSSTAALAQPYYSTASARGGVTVSVRDHRDVDGAWMRKRINSRKRIVVRPQVNWYASAQYNYQPSYTSWEPSYPVAQPSWTTLMPAQPLGYEGRAFVRVDSQPGALHALRLDAATGDTFVNSIDVEYTDGRHQVVTVGQELEAENPSYEVALNSTCGIDDIMINGRSEYGGSLALTAL